MILFTTILFILSVSLSEYFRFLEKRFREGQDVPFLPYNRLWYGFKGLYQACFITLVGYSSDVRYALLGSVLFWITHDIFTNLGLGVKWNYLDTTALLDRIFRKWWIQFLVKLILLTISILLIWIF